MRPPSGHIMTFGPPKKPAGRNVMGGNIGYNRVGWMEELSMIANRTVSLGVINLETQQAPR